MKPIAIIAIIAAIVVVGGACAGVAFSGVLNGDTTSGGVDTPVEPTEPVEPTPTETPTETPTQTPTDSSMSYFSPMTSSSSSSSSSSTPSHSHTWGEWESDGEGSHVRYCNTCETGVETEECTYGAWSPEEGKSTHVKACTKCLYEVREACEDKNPQEIEGDERKHTSGGCDACGREADEIVYCLLTYTVDEETDGQHTPACEVCEAVYNREACYLDAYTSNDDGTHTVACSKECGYTKPEDGECVFSAEPTYDLNLDDPVKIEICDMCGYKKETPVIAAIGKTGYVTLAYALEAATDGDEIRIFAGEHDVTTTDSMKNEWYGGLILGKSVTLTAADPTKKPTLYAFANHASEYNSGSSGQATIGVVASNVILENLKIMPIGGYEDNTYSWNKPVGVATSATGFQMTGCEILENTKTRGEQGDHPMIGAGAGMLHIATNDAVLTGNTFGDKMKLASGWTRDASDNHNGFYVVDASGNTWGQEYELEGIIVIDDTAYVDHAVALEQAVAGKNIPETVTTVKILEAGTYTIPIGSKDGWYPTNIIVEGAVDDVVLTWGTNVLNILNGATFKNVAFAQTITFTGYGTFEDVTFLAGTSHCNPQGNIVLTNCVVNDNSVSVSLHVSNKTADFAGSLTATGCTFKATVTVEMGGLGTSSFTGCTFEGKTNWAKSRIVSYNPIIVDKCTFSDTYNYHIRLAQGVEPTVVTVVGGSVNVQYFGSDGKTTSTTVSEQTM